MYTLLANKQSDCYSKNLQAIKSKKIEQKIPKVKNILGYIKESQKQGTTTQEEYDKLKAFNILSVGYNGSSSIYGQRDLALEIEDFSFPVFLSSFTNYLKHKSIGYNLQKWTMATLNYNSIDYKVLKEFVNGKDQKQIYEEFKIKNKSNVKNQSKMFNNFDSFMDLIGKTLAEN